MITTHENDIEQGLIAKLCDLKYTYRPDIRDRASLEQNFRAKFEELNRVNLQTANFLAFLTVLSRQTFLRLQKPYAIRTLSSAKTSPRCITHSSI